jgi:hypothetical protein
MQQQQPSLSSQLFGLIIPGKEVITNFAPADTSGTKYTLTIPFPVEAVQSNPENAITSISDIVFFLLPNVSLPPNTGAMIYWSASSSNQAAPSSSFELLGALTPTQTSAILRTGWSTNEPLHNLISSLLASPNTTINITFGISIEPIENINNLNVMKNSVNERKNVAQKIALDLFNYLQSFDDTQMNGKGWMNVPTNVFDRWFKRFEMKIGRDPNFFMKSSKE